MDASLITWTVLDWVDVFATDTYRKAITASLAFCQQRKGLRIHAWVIMTSEVQLVVSAGPGVPLRDIMRDSKAFTSAEIHRHLRYGPDADEPRKRWMVKKLVHAGRNNPANYDFQLWQQVYAPVTLVGPDAVMRAIQVLHERPVHTGFVLEAAHWRWGSAVDYAGGKGMLEIEKVV